MNRRGPDHRARTSRPRPLRRGSLPRLRKGTARHPGQDKAEEQECDRHDDAAPEDVVDQPVDVLDLGQYGSAERGDAMLNDAQPSAGGEHRTPPNSPRARAAMAIPSPARKPEKRNRTFWPSIERAVVCRDSSP